MLLVQFCPTMVKHSGGTTGGQRGAHAPPNHRGGGHLAWPGGRAPAGAMLCLVSFPDRIFPK